MAQIFDSSEWERQSRPAAPEAPEPAKPAYPPSQDVKWTVGSSGDVNVKGITWYSLTSMTLGPNPEDVRYRIEIKVAAEEEYFFTDADGNMAAIWASRVPGPHGAKYTSKNPTIVKVSTQEAFA